MLIQHVAAQTRTPPHYLLGAMGSFPSGESLKATETGLVAKVRRKMLSFGEGWEEAMRLAFAVEGEPTRKPKWSTSKRSGRTPNPGSSARPSTPR